MANTYTDLLKLRMPALGDIGWDDEVNDNAKIADFVFSSVLKSNVVIDGIAPSDGGGLDVDTTAGNVVVGGAAHAVASDTKTCTAAAVNWLYVDDTGALQVSTTQPTGNYVAVAIIDAGSSAINRIGDARNIAEGALTIGVDYTPSNYTPDTGETGAINQHLAGVDDAFAGISVAAAKNKIINGAFDFWQRGTSFTGDEYGADRWRIASNGSTKTLDRQAFTLGQTDVPGEPVYYARVAVTSSAGASNYCYLSQRIEGVRTLAGQQCTVSFYAKADAVKNIAIEFYQTFGTGGSPSAAVEATADAVALSATWQKITLTVNVPSIAGKTLGTDGNDYLQLGIWLDAGSDLDSRTDTLGQQSGTFEFCKIQVEAGAAASDFEARSPGEELALCQRYFSKTYDLDTAPGTVTQVGAIHRWTMFSDTKDIFSVDFPQHMRAIPTVTYYSRNTGTAGKVYVINQGDYTVSSVNYTSRDRTGYLQLTGGPPAGYYFQEHYTADAEL
jgi:hypothetical protein